MRAVHATARLDVANAIERYWIEHLEEIISAPAISAVHAEIKSRP